MFDIHRHLPLENELSIPTDWHIWFATSSPSEWATLQALPSNPRWKHGYGLSPQWLSANKITNQLFEQLTQLLQDDPSGYLGEFGLDDRYAKVFPLIQQITIAKRLLHIACDMGRPAVTHHVGSPALLFDLLEAAPTTIPILIHGFLGSVESARELHTRGCYISLGPRVWMQNTRLGKRLHDLALPFALETDFPFIPGKKAGPAEYQGIMKNHYTQIAKLLEVEHLEERFDELTSVLTHW